jgi:hypothetical protein
MEAMIAVGAVAVEMRTQVGASLSERFKDGSGRDSILCCQPFAKAACV